MSNKKKGNSKLMKLLSNAGTGFFFVKKVNVDLLKSKNFVLKKYDPKIRKHVFFNLKKIK